MLKRLVIIVMLLSLLIPATIFASGDGDVPEGLRGMVVANTNPTDIALDDDCGICLSSIWNMLINTISLLP